MFSIKFFRIINPTIAFFGQKDLQQLQVVKALTKQIGWKADPKTNKNNLK